MNKIRGKVTFDTVVPEDGVHDIEGCFRLDEGDWRVYYFTHSIDGEWWHGFPVITKNAVWQSGISGVNVIYPVEKILNKKTVVGVLSEVLDVAEWSEVAGPNSLQLK